MLLDADLYQRICEHSIKKINTASEALSPFPHVVIADVFPKDIYEQILGMIPSPAYFNKANARHVDEYGNSNRQRMRLCEAAFQALSDRERKFWTTIRAAISSVPFRDAIFQKLSYGMQLRYGDKSRKAQVFPRGTLYSEQEGYRIAPHPDTRDKVVTMQFAFPTDDRLAAMGTEFYSRSLNPLHLLREPRGFHLEKTMPFLPNHAYAFTVLNKIGLKSWHGRSTVRDAEGVRNSLLQIWYQTEDGTDRELKEYEAYLLANCPQNIAA